MAGELPPEQMQALARQVALYVATNPAPPPAPPPPPAAAPDDQRRLQMALQLVQQLVGGLLLQPQPAAAAAPLAPSDDERLVQIAREVAQRMTREAARPSPPPAAPRLQPPPAAPRLQPPPAAGLRVQLAAGDAGLRASGKAAPVVAFQGRKAYAVTFQEGVRGPQGSNMNAKLQPAGVFPAEQCRVRAKIWFDKGFPWDPRTMKAVGGKLLGLSMGQGSASGGNYSSTGASMRIMWGKNGGAGPYFYPQLRQPTSKDVTWGDLDQPAELRRVAYIATGVHIFYPDNKNDDDIRKWDLKFVQGAWNQVELFVKLNTPGRVDGVLEMTVNGKTRRLGQIRYRYGADLKITGLSVQPFFGGGNSDWAPIRTARAYFADFEFSNS